MKEFQTIGLDIYLLGFIAFLLVLLVFMLGKVIGLLSAFQGQQNQIAISDTARYANPVSTMDCSEEELAAITAVLTKLMPDQKMNIVNLKLIQ